MPLCTSRTTLLVMILRINSAALLLLLLEEDLWWNDQDLIIWALSDLVHRLFLLVGASQKLLLSRDWVLLEDERLICCQSRVLISMRHLWFLCAACCLLVYLTWLDLLENGSIWILLLGTHWLPLCPSIAHHALKDGVSIADASLMADLSINFELLESGAIDIIICCLNAAHKGSLSWCPCHYICNGTLEVNAYFLTIACAADTYGWCCCKDALQIVIETRRVGYFLSATVMSRDEVLLELSYPSFINKHHLRLVTANWALDFRLVIWGSSSLWWIIKARLLCMLLGFANLDLWSHLLKTVDPSSHQHLPSLLEP